MNLLNNDYEPITQCTINARKLDGRIHRSWEASLIHMHESLLVFEGVFTSGVDHPELGVIRPGTVSIEYYWLDRWFNVFRFAEPDGTLRCFYCNVNMPPAFGAGVLDYVDLDIDILWTPGESPKILDLDEFEANQNLLGYSGEILQKARCTVDEVLAMIERLDFPFKGSS